jgi:hypothetical protein
VKITYKHVILKSVFFPNGLKQQQRLAGPFNNLDRWLWMIFLSTGSGCAIMHLQGVRNNTRSDVLGIPLIWSLILLCQIPHVTNVSWSNSCNMPGWELIKCINYKSKEDKVKITYPLLWCMCLIAYDHNTCPRMTSDRVGYSEETSTCTVGSYSRSILSHLSIISSSSLSTSGNTMTLFTSSGLTRLSWLHSLRHSSACIDWTERHDRTCDRSRWPRLNSWLTSIEVAKSHVSYLSDKRGTSHTRNTQVINGHARQLWVWCMTLVPPSNGVSNMLYIWTEVPIEFGTQISWFGWSECRKVIKNIITLRFILWEHGIKEKKTMHCMLSLSMR